MAKTNVGDFLKKLRNNSALFALGGIGYTIIEILWRGRTHWTMSILGGTCFVTLYKFYKKYTDMKLLKRCFSGGIIITALEFLCGLIVNVKLKLNVWNYSNCKFNIKGQICLLYSTLWMLLCIPVSGLCRKISGVKKNNG